MKNQIRSKYDASAPIIRPCRVDVSALWNKSVKEESVSAELNRRVLPLLKEHATATKR